MSALIGLPPESAKVPGYDGGYKLEISLDNIFTLAEKGVELEFTTPPPWKPQKNAHR